MKKMLLTAALCGCIQFLVVGSSLDDFLTPNDSLDKVTSQQVLHTVGAKVYKGDTLLTKTEVLRILGGYPSIATKYEKGKNLRKTSGLLIAGGIVTMTGGIVLMIKGIETGTADYGYYSDSEVHYNSNYYLGLAIGSIGELMLDGGIACSIIGKILIKRSINNYNTIFNASYKYEPGKIYYQVGLLNNGKLGLRLTF